MNVPVSLRLAFVGGAVALVLLSGCKKEEEANPSPPRDPAVQQQLQSIPKEERGADQIKKGKSL